MIYVYFKAPFGAFRPFQSTELHPTANFITHSAAYGFLLGLGGIERRRKHVIEGANLALGIPYSALQLLEESGTLDSRAANEMLDTPRQGRAYRQLHKEPQSDKQTSAETRERAKGTKPTIDIFRRDFLYGLKGYIGLDHSDLENLVKQGINEPETLRYWGLPFMGDNNFFVERIEVVQEVQPCRWFCPFENNKSSRGDRLHYLSVWTDYENSVRSKSLLFSLEDSEQDDGNYQPPCKAWIPMVPADDALPN